MTMKELQGFRNEFEMACAAQDGDKKAWLAMWNHYRAMMMSRLTAAKGFTREELESEACEVFANKLRLFDRKKVSSETAFSMFSWLFCGTVNKTNRLICQRKKDVHLYFEDVNASFSIEENHDEEDDVGLLGNQMLGINDDIYFTYSPERLVVERLHDNDTKRVKSFYARLSLLEKNILEARREGLTLVAVAKKFGCSVTTVKNHIRVAKQQAEDIFEICYA
jgi:DNA-directed RNA polymerase specialized sigma24 family protein